MLCFFCVMSRKPTSASGTKMISPSHHHGLTVRASTATITARAIIAQRTLLPILVITSCTPQIQMLLPADAAIACSSGLLASWCVGQWVDAEAAGRSREHQLRFD